MSIRNLKTRSLNQGSDGGRGKKSPTGENFKYLKHKERIQATHRTEEKANNMRRTPTSFKPPRGRKRQHPQGRELMQRRLPRHSKDPPAFTWKPKLRGQEQMRDCVKPGTRC